MKSRVRIAAAVSVVLFGAMVPSASATDAEVTDYQPTSSSDVAASSTEWTGPDPTLAPPEAQPSPDDSYSVEDEVDTVNPAPLTRPAGQPAGICDGKRTSYLVKRYQYVEGQDSVPLRCGRWSGGSGWGYLKLKGKGRWNAWYDGMIAATLQNPAVTQTSGTSVTYYTRWFTECEPEYRFKVVTEKRDIGGAGKMGIITAAQDFPG